MLDMWQHLEHFLVTTEDARHPIMHRTAVPVLSEFSGPKCQ